MSSSPVVAASRVPTESPRFLSVPQGRSVNPRDVAEGAALHPGLLVIEVAELKNLTCRLLDDDAQIYPEMRDGAFQLAGGVESVLPPLPEGLEVFGRIQRLAA